LFPKLLTCLRDAALTAPSHAQPGATVPTTQHPAGPSATVHRRLLGRWPKNQHWSTPPQPMTRPLFSVFRSKPPEMEIVVLWEH